MFGPPKKSQSHRKRVSILVMKTLLYSVACFVISGICVKTKEGPFVPNFLQLSYAHYRKPSVETVPPRNVIFNY